MYNRLTKPLLTIQWKINVVTSPIYPFLYETELPFCTNCSSSTYKDPMGAAMCLDDFCLMPMLSGPSHANQNPTRGHHRPIRHLCGNQKKCPFLKILMPICEKIVEIYNVYGMNGAPGFVPWFLMAGFLHSRLKTRQGLCSRKDDNIQEFRTDIDSGTRRRLVCRETE